MAIPNVTRDALPFYQPRYTPDTSRLASIIASGGRDLALLSQARGNNQAEGLMRLASILSGGLEGMRADKAAKAAAIIREQERADDRTFKASESEKERKERADERKADKDVRDAIRAEDKAERATAAEESKRRFDLQENRARDAAGASAMDRAADNYRSDQQLKLSQAQLALAQKAAQTKQATPEFFIRDGQVLPLQPKDVRAGDIPYSASAMQGKAGESADTRSMRTAAALNSIDTLKSLAPKRTPGPMGMAEGAVEKLKGYAGYNTNVRQYQALLQPTAMQMAVAIQGAAGLSNAEREAMTGMLGNISTMDYETQMALLDKASELIGSGADVQRVRVKNQKGAEVEKWMPMRSRMPGGVTVNPATVANPAAGGVKVLSITPVPKG